MPIDLSVKQVPDDVAERLRERAKRNHRSLQGELRAVLDEAAREGSGVDSRHSRRIDSRPRAIAPRSEAALIVREDRDGRTLTVQDLFEYVSSLGRSTPDEATAWIRRLRTTR